MSRPMLIGLFTAALAWVIRRNLALAAHNAVPAEKAAAKLRQAWADHHTVA